VNDRGCFRCRAVFACHDPSVRFRSCVLLSSEVFVDKGVFGVPTLILACHECCRGNRFYSMLLKMPRPSCVLPKNLLSFFGFCQVSPPFFRNWRGELVSYCQQHYSQASNCALTRIQIYTPSRASKQSSDSFPVFVHWVFAVPLYVSSDSSRYSSSDLTQMQF